MSLTWKCLGSSKEGRNPFIQRPAFQMLFGQGCTPKLAKNCPQASTYSVWHGHKFYAEGARIRSLSNASLFRGILVVLVWLLGSYHLSYYHEAQQVYTSFPGVTEQPSMLAAGSDLHDATLKDVPKTI